MRILRGNDVIVKWTINFDNGGLTIPVDFSKSTLTVYFVDSYGKREVEHTVDRNVISVHIGGEIQRLGTCYLDAYWQNNDNSAWHRAKVNNVIEFVDNPESINFDNFIPDVDIITIGCVSDVVFGGSYIANFDNYYTKSEVDNLIKTGGGGGGTKNYLDLNNKPFDLVNNDWQSTKHVSFPTGGFFGAYNTGVSGASIDGDGNAEVGTLIVRNNKIIIGGKEFNPSDAAITQEIFDKLLEKWWKYDAENNAIYSTYNVYSTGSLTAKGINKQSGDGGAKSLGQLVNVDPAADDVQTEDKVLYRKSGETHWSMYNLNDIKGLDTTALNKYLIDNHYTTETFVNNKITTAITPLDQRITDHANDTNVHITNAERIKWNKIASYFAEDTANDAIYVTEIAENRPRNFYGLGSITARGINKQSGGGSFNEELMWSLLGDGDNPTKQIALSHLQVALATYATQDYVNNRGFLVATTADKNNWNTAYGWGNHATAGYAKTTDLSKYVTIASKGQPNGVVPLDSTGLISSVYLPAYVDDVLEFDSVANFPQTGEKGKIYVATDNNLTYRWTGTQYIEISKSIGLGETADTAYAGDKGKRNADNISTLFNTQIIAGTGLTGGGKLNANVTLSLKVNNLWGNAYSGTSSIGGTIVPLANGVSDIGTESFKFRNGYFSNAIKIGDAYLLWEASNNAIKVIKYDSDGNAAVANFYATGSVTAKGINKTGGGGGGNVAISTLVDVTLTSLSDKDVLIYNGTSKHWENKPQSSIIPDLSKYVTLNTAQSITGIKTFVGNNFNFYHEDGYLNIVQKSSYTGGWARGLNFKNDNDTQYAVIGGYGNANTFNYVYIGQSYDSRWITFASTGVKSSVDLEATKFKKTGGTSAQFLKADGSIDSNSYLTTVSASSTYVRKVGDIMTGALTVPNLTISRTDPVKHIAFSRADFNYITAPANGTIAFITKNVDVGASVSDFMISTGIIRPGTTNVVTNGNSSYRWSNIYSVLGNFSGVITAGSHINAVGNINADGTITSGRDVVANNYIKSTNGWFQNDVAQAGLYNKAGDARWMWNGSYWYADKSIYSTNLIKGKTLESYVSTGTAPLVVASSTLVKNLNANYVGGYDSGRLLRTKAIGSRVDYEKYVILLFQTEEIANHRLDGYFYTSTNGSNRYYRTDVSIWHSRWSSTGQDGTYSCINKNYQEGGLKLITVTYQGKEWVAMDSANASIRAKSIYFAGDWSSNVQFTLVSYYKVASSTPAAILNSEINDSRKDLASDNILVGNNTIAYISSNVASATKLETARLLWGQSFDGTANVTGELKHVTRVSNATNSNLFLGNSDGTGWVQSINLCASAGTVYWSLRNTGVGHFRRINIGDTENDDSNYRLAIAGSIYMNGNIISPYFRVDYSSTNPYYSLTKDSKIAYFQLYDTKAYLGFGKNNSINITQDGNVGIGLGTTNPSTKLHVGGNAIINNDLNVNGNLGIGQTTKDGTYIRIGAIQLVYDAANNALKVVKHDGSIGNFYATGSLTAKGINKSGGGGGGNYSRLDAWNDYTSDKSTWVLSAGLGWDLNSRVSNLESGSALSITTSGTGEFLTGASKSGTVITFTKGTPNYIKSSTTERDIKPNSTGNGLLKLYFATGSNVGLTGGYADALFLNSYVDNSGGGTNLITFDKRNGEMAIHYQAFGATAWGTRRVVLDSGNFANYAPTKTGGGASGTWGINITGNANSATSLQNIRYIGISGGATGSKTSFNGTYDITIPVTKIDPSKSYYENGKLLIKKIVCQYIHEATQTGIIKLTAPAGWTSAMVGIEIDVYDYTNSSGYTKILIGGYNYGGESRWINTSVSILGNYSHKVRLAYDGSKCCILLGTINSTWNYPKVVIRNIMSGYSGFASFDGNWTTSLITTESGLSSIIEPVSNDKMIVGIARGCSGNAATATNISNTGTVTLATATENNAITITQPSYTGNQPVKLLNFNWYNDVWSIGNIRNYNATSAGLGIFEKGSEIAKFAINALHVPTLVIRSQNQESHIKFTRPNLNYISCDTSGYIGFVTNGKDPNGANSDVIISGNMIYPGTNNLVINGTDANRWKGVYSVIGNFTGAVTMSAGLSISGSVRMSTDWIRFTKNGIGLYYEVSDARWFYDGAAWTADKAIVSSSTITGTRLIANVAQGTAPLTITSNTLVRNLNVDLLDNYHASEAATASSIVARTNSNQVYLNYINSNTTTNENSDLDQFIVTKPNDNFYRKYSRDYVRVRLNDFINNCKTLDLTSLDQNTYYPCSVTISAKEPTTINIFVSLNSGSKPSWSTHTNGFTMNLSWQVFGGGWGTTAIQRKIFNYYVSSVTTGVQPCGGIEQNAYASTEIVYLRGGAKYLYTISNSTSAIAINTNGYSWSSGSTTYSAPTMSAPKKHPSLCYEASSMLGAYNIYANYLQISSISVDGTVTAATFKIDDNNYFQAGRIELSASTPYIDFHFNNSTSDYTHRIIAATATRLDITTELQVNGQLTAKSKILSTVSSTGTNNWSNLSTLNTVLAAESNTVGKDSCQPIFRWANQITEGYLTRYIIGSARSVGNGFGQIRLWVGNNDAGTAGNWFALNNNGVVSTSLTYFETSNVGFKTGSAVFGATTTTVAEVSSGTNEIIFSSGVSNINVNYRQSGMSRTIPTIWYWRAGSSTSWANFEIGKLVTHGNVTINGITSTSGNLDVDGNIGATGTITSTRLLSALGGLDVTDNAMFNNDATFDGTTYFNDVMNINTAVTLNGDVALNGTIRGNSSSKIICDGIGISAGNKESGCIISGNPNVWNIALDHNDIQARNNGSWSEIFINDYGGNVYIGTSSYTTTIKSLNTILGGSNNTSLTIGQVKLVYDSANNALKVVSANGGVANFYSTGSLTAKGINTGKQDLLVNGVLYCNNRAQFNVNSNEGSRIDFLNPKNTILGNSGVWTIWGNMGDSYSGALEFWIYPGSGSSYSNASIFSLRPNGSATLRGALSQNVGSDIRLKTNKDYDVDYCERLLSLGKVFDYNYNDKAKEINAPGYDNNKHTGLMYHKVKDIMPHITRVFHEDYGGIDYTHTDYINLIAGATQMNILGLRKLLGVTNDIKDDIVELKERLNKVEKENEELKKKLALLENK
jgi:hypothetical protein